MIALRELTSTRERLWLLAHDHRDMRPLIDPRALAIGLAGGVLTDLLLAERIHVFDGAVTIAEQTGTPAAAGDPITAAILTRLHRTPGARVSDVLHAARPDLPEDPYNPYQRLYDRTAAALVAADILVEHRRLLRGMRYQLLDPSHASWIRGQVNRRLVYCDGPDELSIDLLCALAWAVNLHHKLLMPFNAAEAEPILAAITARIPGRVGQRSALAVVPDLAQHVRHTIGDLATAAF